MDVKKLREIMAHYVALDPNDAIGMDECWQKMTDILVSDMQATIDYFRAECTDEEFYWLGPVFEDVVEKTQRKEFVQVLRERLAKVLPEKYRQQNFKSEHMRNRIDYAEYVRELTVDIEFAEARMNDAD